MVFTKAKDLYERGCHEISSYSAKNMVLTTMMRVNHGLEGISET